MLITRPLEDSRAVAAQLESDGIETLIWPLTAIRPVATAIAVPPLVDGLLFTSAHGARAFAALSQRRDLPALCVGHRTAEIARQLGFAAVPSGGDAAALARMAVGSGLRHFFHPRGRDTTGDLPGQLQTSGQRVSEAVVYAAEETGPPPAPVAHALASGRIAAIGFWSPRNARIFARHRADGLAMAHAIHAVVISPRAADPLAAAGFDGVVTAAKPEGGAMLDALRAIAGTPHA
ncbi:MAG: uroporphyrinogen-III synthase [Pseudomonadota bacterium]